MGNQPQRQQNNSTNAMDALMASNNYEGDQSTPPLQATPLSRSLSNSIPKHTTNSEELFVPSSTASLLSTLTRNVSDNVFRRAPTAPIPQDDPELIAELNALREIEQQYRKDKKLLKKAKSKKAYQFYQQQLMKKGWCIWKKTIRMQHITQRLKHRFQRKHLHAAFQTWHNNMKQNQTLSKIKEIQTSRDRLAKLNLSLMPDNNIEVLNRQMAIREQEIEQERIAKATRALKSFLNQKLRGAFNSWIESIVIKKKLKRLMSRYKYRTASKCYDALALHAKTERKIKNDIQLQQQNEALQKLSQEMKIMESNNTSPFTKNNQKSKEIIIIPDPSLLKEIQILKTQARQAVQAEERREYDLARSRSRKALHAWRHRQIYSGFNTWRTKFKKSKVLRRVIGRTIYKTVSRVINKWRQYVNQTIQKKMAQKLKMQQDKLLDLEERIIIDMEKQQQKQMTFSASAAVLKSIPKFKSLLKKGKKKDKNQHGKSYPTLPDAKRIVASDVSIYEESNATQVYNSSNDNSSNSGSMDGSGSSARSNVSS